MDRHDWVERNMSHHTPSDDVVKHIVELREYAKAFGHTIARVTPESREASLAMTALEEALMWAVASIARSQVSR